MVTKLYYQQHTHKNMEKYKKYIQSKTFRNLVCYLGVILFTLAVFQAGIVTGYRKASFSYTLGDNYYKTFERGSHHMMGGFPRGKLPDSHGAVGKIIKIDLPLIVVAGPDGIEKIVSVTNDTSIRQFKEQKSITDLHVDEYVVIIGSPNNTGQIEAKFIRLMPPPPPINEQLTPNLN